MKKKQKKKKVTITKFPFNYFQKYDSPLLEKYPKNLRMTSDHFIENYNKLMNYYESIGGMFGEEDASNIINNSKVYLNRDKFEQVSLLPYKYYHNNAISTLPLELRIVLYEQQLELHPKNYRIAERLALSYKKLNKPIYKERMIHYYKYAYSLMYSRYIYYSRIYEIKKIISGKIEGIVDLADLVKHDYLYQTERYIFSKVSNLIRKENQIKNDITFSCNVCLSNLNSLLDFPKSNNMIEESQGMNFLREAADLTNIQLIKNLAEAYFDGVPLTDNEEYFNSIFTITLKEGKDLFEKRKITPYEVINKIQAQSLIYFVDNRFFRNKEEFFKTDVLDVIASYPFKDNFTIPFAIGLKYYLQKNYNSALESIIKAYYHSFGIYKPLVGTVMAFLLNKLNSKQFIYNGQLPNYDIHFLVADYFAILFTFPEKKFALDNAFNAFQKLNVSWPIIIEEVGNINPTYKKIFPRILNDFMLNREISQKIIDSLPNSLPVSMSYEEFMEIQYDNMCYFAALYLTDFADKIKTDKHIDIKNSFNEGFYKSYTTSDWSIIEEILKATYSAFSKCDPLYAKLIKPLLT